VILNSEPNINFVYNSGKLRKELAAFLLDLEFLYCRSVKNDCILSKYVLFAKKPLFCDEIYKNNNVDLCIFTTEM
jgi:hypothetical protein